MAGSTNTFRLAAEYASCTTRGQLALYQLLPADQTHFRSAAPYLRGGTSGVLPSVLDVPEVVDQVAAGDRQKILYENTTGGAIVVNGFIDYRPGG